MNICICSYDRTVVALHHVGMRRHGVTQKAWRRLRSHETTTWDRRGYVIADAKLLHSMHRVQVEQSDLEFTSTLCHNNATFFLREVLGLAAAQPFIPRINRTTATVVLDHRVDQSKLLHSQQRMKPVVVVIIGTGMVYSMLRIKTVVAFRPSPLRHFPTRYSHWRRI